MMSCPVRVPVAVGIKTTATEQLVLAPGFAACVRLAKVSAYCDAFYRARCRAGRAKRHGLRRAGSPNTLIRET